MRFFCVSVLWGSVSVAWSFGAVAQTEKPLPARPAAFFAELAPIVADAQQSILTDRAQVIQGLCWPKSLQDAPSSLKAKWQRLSFEYGLTVQEQSALRMLSDLKDKNQNVSVFQHPVGYEKAYRYYCRQPWLGRVHAEGLGVQVKPESLWAMSLPPRTWGQEAALMELLRRVDVVPMSQVLAQAALESAYGQSRFAREGHALFGQHCYSKGCGLVPQARSVGQRDEVKSFPNYRAAVVSYAHMLNTSPTFSIWRDLRAKMRMQGVKVTGRGLLKALDHYSERGAQYGKSLLLIINQYNLDESTSVIKGHKNK